MRSARIQLLFLSILACAAVARAEDYYLPQVANGSFGGGSFRTTFVFFNTNDTAVTVRLELTNDQGAALNLTIPGLGTSDEFAITLQPGATRIVQTDGAGSLVAGAAHVSTSADIGVSAVFTVSTPTGSFQTEAGVGNSEGLTDFVIPVDVTGSFNTGVALYDIGGAGATVTLRLINASGAEVGQAPLNLPANGHTAQFVTQLFAGTSNFRGTLRVTSSAPIGAVGLRQNDPPLSYTSLPAVSRSSGSTVFNLPQVANGSFGDGSFKTSFLLFNISGSVANVTLALTKDDGTPFPVTIAGQGTNSTFNLQLAPGASSFLQTDGTGSLAAGAARITSNVPLGAAAIFTVLNPQGGFQTEAGVGDSAALTELTLPVDVTGSFDTGIAFYVPGSVPVTLNMKLLDVNGGVAATAQPLILQPKSHTAKFVTQLFPGTSNFQGSVSISATGGVAALTLRQHSAPLSYTTLPVASGAATGVEPQAGPLLTQKRTGIGATSDSTLDQTLPGGFKLTGTITGVTIAEQVVAKSGSSLYQGQVNALTHNYLVVVPAGTYQLTVCCAQAGAAPGSSIVYTYTDPGSVPVSADTQHNITVPPLAVFDISGRVTGLPAVLPTAQLFAAFTSTDKSVEGNFPLAADGSYQGQLPNGSYVASVQILAFGGGGFQSTSIYNVGAATVNSAPVTANFTAPATARLSGSVKVAGTPVLTQGALFFAEDRSAGIPQPTDCVFPPVSSSSSLDASGGYDTRLVTNRAHGIGVSVPVFKGATTAVAGSASYPALTRDLTLGADAVSDFNLPAFPAQVRITGKVTDSTGKGVKNVSVSAFSKELSGAADLGYAGLAQTDAGGNYELILLSGVNYEIQFIPPTPEP